MRLPHYPVMGSLFVKSSYRLSSINWPEPLHRLLMKMGCDIFQPLLIIELCLAYSEHFIHWTSQCCTNNDTTTTDQKLCYRPQFNWTTLSLDLSTWRTIIVTHNWDWLFYRLYLCRSNEPLRSYSCWCIEWVGNRAGEENLIKNRQWNWFFVSHPQLAWQWIMLGVILIVLTRIHLLFALS